MFTKDLFFNTIGFLYLHWFAAIWSFISRRINKIAYQINSHEFRWIWFEERF